ncbi:hypothetical protein E2562_024739 [Oryza meyeriana var. granulata]|uniref:Uncharacterized protein n=1 Tax=Oryza meyeriana var. granulata TaxID=110450 RepID=A0A6G1D685_9ORYZ|nr:hypothetical protein E2562_024739 [Oryza meyeriana var. granulata]
MAVSANAALRSHLHLSDLEVLTVVSVLACHRPSLPPLPLVVGVPAIFCPADLGRHRRGDCPVMQKQPN